MVVDADSRVPRKAAPEPSGSGHAEAIDRVLRALNHPVRRRILRHLSKEPASASTLAQRFGEELGMVSYHLNQVLAKECGVVELVDTIARRGALEKIYGLDATVWEQLDLADELGASSFGLFPLEVDAATWREIREAREEFEQRVAAAVQDGHQRGVGIGLSRTRRIIVGVAALSIEAPSNGGPPEPQADARI